MLSRNPQPKDLQLRLPSSCTTLGETDMATVLRLPSDRPLTEQQKKSEYTPLHSVWEGEDADLLERMLAFYPRTKPRRILDATMNGGRFWRGSSRPVIGIDIESHHRPAIVADNTRMPFRDSSFDVVVYDPPHIPNQGKDKSKDFNRRFGLVLKSRKENQYTFSHTFPPFVRESSRVLRQE